jgi:hypothetical protein
MFVSGVVDGFDTTTAERSTPGAFRIGALPDDVASINIPRFGPGGIVVATGAATVEV